ncbi:probable LRR receptor-like serine/threonine-protein kinase At3g47570 [Hevea brasiliensis]|uniref:probable LRR receptor-like serine/threonine-protein kinase At3g47570 n=1 Tax=Hevea brasiliensis TaxID=3981 RepID=UPI0025D1EB2D|nr:probable LRR receptor-like serine/threonine-protein kinase At3g47570 [Hevea brasiliensis]
MGLSFRSLSVSFPSLCLLSITYFLCFSFLALAIHRNNDTDRLALLELKAKITDDPFGVMNSWNSTLHFCSWHHVTCGRRHQRVIMLDLSSLKLSGSISPHVGNLSFLRELRLENNSFSREIPTEIGHLRRLQILSLYNNSFGGQIPASISNCSNLVFFHLYNNNVGGRIPAGLGSLKKLKEIFFGANKLIGTLPPSLGNLSSLQKLYVRRNNLHGVVPDTLGQLMNLRILALNGNQFFGTIPPSFFNLSLIEQLGLADNNLEGRLPLSLGISLPNLQVFSISDNQFTGSIPTSISNASRLEVLQLSRNNFIGRVPSLEKLHRLMRFVVSGNHLGSGGKADDLELLSTLSNATNLKVFGIDRNNFGGKLPEQFCNFSEKLKHIWLNQNQIFGNIPSGISDCASLEFLVVRENNLSGSIPSSIGKLLNLGELDFGYNDFSGSIPSSIGNMTNLLRMDLSNNKLQGLIPSSLGNCKNLLELDLSNNNFSGPIPPQIFGSSPLSMGLSLSRNHLSGSIPIEVGNSKAMGYLSLSENMLSGVIPSSLSSCTSLELLDLGANLFRGSLPSSLSTVPIEGVFKNASATSVAGNKNLCGGMPNLRLPPCQLQQSKGGLTITLKIIISTVSVLIGATLVLICFFLCLSRKRKRESSSTSHGKELLKLSYQSLLKATNGFSSDNLIGTGSFGSVYKGILDQEGIVIAVKVFKLMNREASKSFIAECEVLRNVRHRNLVKVLTACSGVDYHGNDFKALVYEFMVNGSLDGWLHPTVGLDEVPRTLSVLQKLNIAIDIACALEYLQHRCGTPIVHCDIKPSNILLDEEMTAHVSDFGLAKFISNVTPSCSTNQSSSIGVRGTIGYCPPEYGMGSQVSTSGDIFSFGILLLEMFTGKRPTDHMFKEGMSLHNFVKRALPEQVTQILDPNNNLPQMQSNANATWVQSQSLGNMRNNIFIECLISIFEIGISCSAESPQERMNIGDIVAQLSSIRKKILETRLQW